MIGPSLVGNKEFFLVNEQKKYGKIGSKVDFTIILQNWIFWSFFTAQGTVKMCQSMVNNTIAQQLQL